MEHPSEDVVSIHQRDDVLKERGIYGLGGFLKVSRELRVLWTTPYPTRLWCISLQIFVLPPTHPHPPNPPPPPTSFWSPLKRVCLGGVWWGVGGGGSELYGFGILLLGSQQSPALLGQVDRTPTDLSAGLPGSWVIQTQSCSILVVPLNSGQSEDTKPFDRVFG